MKNKGDNNHNRNNSNNNNHNDNNNNKNNSNDDEIHKMNNKIKVRIQTRYADMIKKENPEEKEY